MYLLSAQKTLRLFKCLTWLLSLFLGMTLSTPLLAQAPEATSQEELAYQGLFTEEILKVTRERDGILPGTLRTALIEASGIRSQNPFALVKIVFDPSVKRIQISKGPLPQIDGSLTTIDCESGFGRVIIEGIPDGDNAGMDPSEEWSGLKLVSNGNTVRGCHITGFPGSGIHIQGNRNVIERNVIGYHQDIPETQIPPTAVHEEPKTNGGSGIFIGKGSSANMIHHNDIVANTFHGILLSEGVGAANDIAYNFFIKNSGQPIKELPGGNHTPQPVILNITQASDTYLIEGTASPLSKIQVYMLGESGEGIGMLVAEGRTQKLNHFLIATKSKGFVVGETKLIAVAQGVNQNTSEFSNAFLITPPKKDIERAEPVLAGHSDEENGESEPEEIVDSADSPEETERPPVRPIGQNTAKNLFHKIVESPAEESETTINIQGLGGPGGEPDSGTPRENEVSGLGI